MTVSAPATADAGPYVVVLGVAQDAGHPQAGCARECCAPAWKDRTKGHRVASLGLLDPATGGRWIIDATPDLPAQLQTLEALQPSRAGKVLDGVLLTHAHIGHYTGLVHLGREVMGARRVPTYAMPRMAIFLKDNAPWELLVRLGNIDLRPLKDGREETLSPRLRAQPIRVPHRDEYSETVGFVVRGPRRSVLFLPDIDKWARWSTPIEEVLAGVDRAYLDATFYDGAELPGRSMDEIPHPFVVESLARFKALPAAERDKIRFLHLNHTNPLLRPGGEAAEAVTQAGMHVAQEGERFEL